MPLNNKPNQNFMKLIKAVHSLVVTDDLDKNRQSQESIGKILGTKSKEANYTSLNISGISAELVNINRPHTTKTLILYCHGGGYITGSLNYARILTTKLALLSSMDVLSFDYRLAPEFPFPAALEDVLKIWDYLMLKGYSSKDIIVAGDSAGGNLSLSMGLKLKEQNRFLPKAFALMSPWADLTLSGKSHIIKAELDPILDSDYMERARYSYTTDDNFTNPLVSPLFGDYSGFPPVCIQVGNNEILLSDSLLLHKHLVKQEVSAKLHIYKGMWHVFQMSNFKAANDALDELAEFILSV